MTVGDWKRNVTEVSGLGKTLKFAVAITAKVPKEPIMSLPMSRPVTFFTTMPPELTNFPSMVAKRMPMVMSRAEP